MNQPLDHDDEQEELQQLETRSHALQVYLCDVLGNGGYAAVPTLVIHALGELLGRVMAIEAVRDPQRLTFALLTLDSMRARVVKAAGAGPDTVKH